MENKVEETKEKVKGISVRLVIVLIIFAAILLLFLFITDQFVLEGETGFDSKVFDLLSGFASPGATRFMNILTFFGSTNFLFPAYGVLILFYIFYRKNNKRSFNIAAVGLSSVLLMLFIKSIFRRHRPPNPLVVDVKGFSYPSGHSSSAFTFCAILIYILWHTKLSQFWKWTGTVFLFLFATFIAISRVYLHVHYASDVVAGFCLAFLWLTICYFVLTRFNRSKGADKINLPAAQ